jgi:hypothetical protein
MPIPGPDLDLTLTALAPVCAPCSPQVHWLGPPLPPCEAQRNATIEMLGIMGRAEDMEIGSILKLTASMFKAPVALVALFEQHKVFVCDSHGNQGFYIYSFMYLFIC